MSGFARCCCGACECLPIGDLPTVTISGYTGGGWSGFCCFEQTFTPNATQSWSKSCSSMLYEASAAETCVTEHWRILSHMHPGYVVVPDTCEDMPQDFCCPNVYKEKIATTTTEWEWINSAFMAIWRRPAQIIVRVSREEVNCDGVEGQTGGCKIVIRSRYVYDWQSKIYVNSLDDTSQTVEMHNTSCFVVNSEAVYSMTNPSPVTCSDVPSDPPSEPLQNCLFTGSFYFDRVKYYDEMPIGSITFANTDTPGCTSSECDYDPLNYVSSVCIYSPASAVYQTGCIFDTPCYCRGYIDQINATITEDPLRCALELWSLLDGCNNCDPISQCTSVFCLGEIDYECPGTGYSMNRIGFTNSKALDADCDVIGVGSDGVRRGVVNSCGWNKSLEGVGLVYPPYDRNHNCSEEPCNATCCEVIDECPCCVEEECRQIYTGEYFSTVTSHTRSQSCTGISQKSVCTSAPTWTITLS